MAYKLLDAAQERWRRFNGHELVADVLAGAKFKDGERVTDDETTTTDQKVAVLAGFRVRLFTLADELGNVSAACRDGRGSLDLLPPEEARRPLGA
jgi:hypothetical protein